MSKRGKRYKDTEAARARRAGQKKVERQLRDAAIRAKYGPKRRSSKVVVRDLETGEVKAVKSNRAITGERFPAHAERKSFRGPTIE